MVAGKGIYTSRNKNSKLLRIQAVLVPMRGAKGRGD